MRKSTLMTLADYLDGKTITNLDEIRAELEAEINRNAEKAAANRELYAAAKGIVLEQLRLAGSCGVTASELYASCTDELPDGFTKGKLQYALSHYWNDVVSVTETKECNLYRLA